MKRITLLSIVALTMFSAAAFAQTATNLNARSLILLGNTTDLTNTLTIKAPTLGASYTLTFPPTNGSPGDVLTSVIGGALGRTQPGSTSWGLTGNAVTTPGTNFIGTTDAQAFEIHVFETDDPAKGSKRVALFEPKALSPNITLGYQGNAISSAGDGNVILGGGGFGSTNTITGAANNSAIVGGRSNTISSDYSFVGGGQSNTASGEYSAVVGGRSNTASGIGSFIGGGGYDGINLNGNVASGNASVIGGGSFSVAGGDYSVIAGGRQHAADGNFSFVGGGLWNTTSGDFGSIGGGITNWAAGLLTAIPGGRGLRLNGDASFGFNGVTGSDHDMIIDDATTAVFSNTDLWLANK